MKINCLLNQNGIKIILEEIRPLFTVIIGKERLFWFYFVGKKALTTTYCDDRMNNSTQYMVRIRCDYQYI